MINTSSTYNISFMCSLHSLYNNTRVTCSSALSGHPSSSLSPSTLYIIFRSFAPRILVRNQGANAPLQRYDSLSCLHGRSCSGCAASRGKNHGESQSDWMPLGHVSSQFGEIHDCIFCPRASINDPIEDFHISYAS